VAQRFSFRPRYRGVAWTAIGTGGALSALGVILLGAALVPVATGAVGILLGTAYLRSPTWRLAVVTDELGFEVTGRFRLAWQDVVRVVASPTTHTCFVDGGTAAKSLLVPGVGAPAPYSIDEREALFAEIVAHVDPAKVTEVATLETAR
jgi:hypothetical protein